MKTVSPPSSAWINVCLFVVAASAVRLIVDPVLGDRAPYLIYTFIVFLVGMRYGLLPGLFTAAVSTIAGLWMFIPPRFSFGPITVDECANIVAYIAICSAILAFTEQLRQSRKAEAASLAESRTASSKLQESQRRLAGIVDSAMDAIVTFNADRGILLFNPAAERMFGLRAADVCGQSVNRLFSDYLDAGHDSHVQRFGHDGIISHPTDGLGAIYGRRSSGEKFPIEASISHVAVDGEQLTTVILRDITERRSNQEAQASLVREVDHRAKNALAVAQALVSLSSGETIRDYIEAVTGRISSLVRAHSLLSQSRWTGAVLSDLIQGELSACIATHKFAICGPPISLTAPAVQPFSLVLHELATNAIRHGAASAKTGLVSLSWSVAGGQLELTWMEKGGSDCAAYNHPGFGLNLLRRTVESQLDGAVHLEWAPQGLTAVLTIPPSRYFVEDGLGNLVQ